VINLADVVRIGLHQLFDEFEEKSVTGCKNLFWRSEKHQNKSKEIITRDKTSV